MLLAQLGATFLIGFAAAYIGVMVGGGGLLSIPFLIFLGLPPAISIATHKLGFLGSKLTSTREFWRNDKIVWRHVPPLSVVTMTGSFMGARMLIQLNSELISKSVGVLILLLLPVIFFRPDIGVERMESSRKRRYIGFLIYTVASIYSAMFSGGAGTLYRYVLIFFLGVTLVEASATIKIPGLLGSLMALSVLGASGVINYPYGISMAIGTALGGRLGAKRAIEGENEWVKRIFGTVVVISAVKLLLF